MHEWPNYKLDTLFWEMFKRYCYFCTSANPIIARPIFLVNKLFALTYPESATL